MAIQKNAACGMLIKAQQQFHHRAFARPRGANDAEGRAGWNREIETMEQRLTPDVSELHIFKPQVTAHISGG